MANATAVSDCDCTLRDLEQTTNYDGGLLALSYQHPWGCEAKTAANSVCMRIDFSAEVPSDATIDDATLYLYITDIQNSMESTVPSDLSWYVRRCPRAWVTDEATWTIYSTGNNWTTGGARGAGTDYTTPSVHPTGQDETGWWAINVKDLVVDAQADRSQVFDVVLHGPGDLLEEAYIYYEIPSYIFQTTALRPYLSIDYTPTAELTGTAVPTMTQADVVAGGKTIIITLSTDTWVDGTFDAQRQAIIDGLDSAQSEGAGWDATVKGGIPVTDVVRTSDTVVTITLSAVAGYYMTATETITCTVPAAALVGGSPIVAIPTFTVTGILCDDQIDASTDDAHQRGDGPMYVDGVLVNVTSHAAASSRYHGGLRFHNGTFPSKGSTILAAYLEMAVYDGGYDDANCDIYAEDAAGPTTFTEDNNDITDRTPTTASAAWVADSVGTGWIQSPSLVSVIQELVDDYDVTAIAVLLLARSDVGKALWSRSWDYDVHVLGAKLHIEWTVPPAGGATQTFTLTPAVAQAAVPSPQIDLMLQILLPTPAVSTAVVPSPALSLVRTLTPDPAIATAGIPSPATSLALTLVPDPAVAIAVVPSPMLAALLTLVPDPAIAVAVVPSPALTSLVILTPFPAAAAAAVPSPALTLIKTLLPTPVSVLAVVPVPGLDLAILILLQPTPAAAVAVVPMPCLDVIALPIPLTLLEILKKARQELAEERRQSPIACPECGEPLDENRQGTLSCPMGHWESFRWERP